MQPLECGDIRCVGQPTWWNYWYGPDARVAGAKAAFAPVAAAVTAEEVATTIKKCDGGKSPGLDGVSIDLLKLLVGDDLGPGRSTVPADQMPLACLMAELTSLSIKLGRMTPRSLGNGAVRPARSRDMRRLHTQCCARSAAASCSTLRTEPVP